MVRNVVYAVVVVLFLAPRTLCALGPHEVLLLANSRSAQSVSIAREYAKLRGIPESNIVELAVSQFDAADGVRISSDQFTEHIWKPACAVVRERGLQDQILAWVYSTQFPTVVHSAYEVSITGLTFLRNQWLEEQDVKKAVTASPLFCGPIPDGRTSTYFAPKTLDVWKDWLRDDMPLPSMMLGYTGKRGNEQADVIACLRRGVESDATKPSGTVYFATNDDVRSACRDWQFARAASALQRLGVNAVVMDMLPSGRNDVLGLMTGARTIKPASVGTFLPGSMAEHFTSFAAAFHVANQTKLSAWIKNGATASSGTVTEPLANWRKIPSAHFYAHYASGCTMLESFFLAVRSPFEILFVGEPLASPWKSKAVVTIRGLENATVSVPRTIRADVEADEGMRFRRFVYLVDGRVKGEGDSFLLDPSGLAEGEHTFRVVAYSTGFVAQQAFEERTFNIEAR